MEKTKKRLRETDGAKDGERYTDVDRVRNGDRVQQEEEQQVIQ